MEFDSPQSSEPSFSVLAQDVGEQDITLGNPQTPLPVLASTAHKEKNRKDIDDEFQQSLMAGSYMESGADDKFGTDPERDFQFLDFLKQDGSHSNTQSEDDPSLGVYDFNAMSDSGSLVHVDSNISLGSWLGEPATGKTPSVSFKCGQSGMINESKVPQNEKSASDYSRIASLYLLSESQLNNTERSSSSSGAQSCANASEIPPGGTPAEKSKSREECFDDFITDTCTGAEMEDQNDAPGMLDFSVDELRDEMELQQEFFSDEQFAGDAAEILDKDEEIFEEENKLLIHSEEEVADVTGMGFSALADSPFNDVNDPKMSIGAYMAARSGKMGRLGEEEISVERPSFGMKIRTPSPRKPYPLLKLGTVQETFVAEGEDVHTKSTSVKHPSQIGAQGLNSGHDDTLTPLEPSELGVAPDQAAKPDENDNDLSKDTTLEPSVLSLSQVIMNMSTSVNNEELAQAIIDMTKKKRQGKAAKDTKKRESRRGPSLPQQVTSEKGTKEAEPGQKLKQELPGRKPSRQSSKIPVGASTSPPKPIRLSSTKRSSTTRTDHKKTHEHKPDMPQEVEKAPTYSEHQSKPMQRMSSSTVTHAKEDIDVAPISHEREAHKKSYDGRFEEKRTHMPGTVTSCESAPLRSVENMTDYTRPKSKGFKGAKQPEKIVPQPKSGPSARLQKNQSLPVEPPDVTQPIEASTKVGFLSSQAEYQKPAQWKDIMQESFMQDTPEQDVVVEKSASEHEELPTFSHGRESVCFPDETTAKYLLSSTRTDLSLTRGSLSRESIEQLHKKLRVRGPRSSNRGDLPDLISPPLMREPKETLKENEKELETEVEKPAALDDTVAEIKNAMKDSRDSLHPLSQSSPEGKSCRYSGEFQHMLPSMSFAEMATIQEHEFDLRDLDNQEEEAKKNQAKAGKLDVIQEEAETTQDTTISSQSTASGDSQLPSEISQDPNLIHPMQQPLPPHVPMMHSSQHLYPSVPHVMYRLPTSMASTSMPAPYATDMHYRPVDGHYPLPPDYMGRGPQMYPHPYGYPMSSSFAHHPMLHSTAPAGYPLEQPSMASGPDMGLNQTTSTMYQQRSYQHPSMTHGPRSAPVDGRFHSFPETYFHQHHRRVEGISVPTELVFPGVRCTSLLSHAKLPLVNKTDRWIQVELNIVSPAIDCCFSLESKPLVGPHDSKNVEVSFSPKKAGQFDALLEVISYPVTAEGAMLHNARSAPSVVVLKAVAEDAKAELCGPDDTQELNFGETMCDSAKFLPLRLVNKSSAEVPVCVMLCTKLQDRQCFAISETSNLDWSNLDRRSQAILRAVLPVGDRVTTVWVHCRIPPKYCDAAEPPKSLSAQVYMEIDNSQKQSLDTVVLDSISVEVTACVAKLHAPKNMQPMNFSCTRESSQTLTIPVKNCGNVSSRVTFSLLDSADVFSVTPVHALLAAGDHVQVSVRFQPVRSTPSQLKPVLLMKIEPNGAKYEVMINASCVEQEMTRQSATPSDARNLMPSLLTNKSHICWGGVTIGKSLQQRVVLRTSSGASKPLPMRVMVKGDDASFFQILCEDDNDREELSSRQEITMRAGQDKIIRILFGPTKCRMALAKLEIKAPVDQVPSTKFTIPLSGYGGRSEMKILDLESISSQEDAGADTFAAYLTGVSEVKHKSQQQITFSVKNESSRDAFVKAVLFRDHECKVPFVEDATRCSPSQFVLPKRSTRSVTVSVESPPPSERTGHTRDGRDMLASLCLWHGDEVSRQLLKCALSKLGPSAIRKSLSENNPLRNVSFDGIFEGEGSSSPEEDLSSVRPQLGDVQVFFTSIRKAVVQVFGPPTRKPLLEMVEAGRKNMAQWEGRQTHKQTDAQTQKHKRSEQRESEDKSWALVPDHVALSAPRHGVSNEPSKIKLVNRSGESLRFEVVWPGHCLTITPDNGRVDPESVLVLLLNANPSLASRRDILPWLGTVQVSGLDGRGTKMLRVQIRDDAGPLDASAQPATPVPRLPLKAQYSEIPSADSFATPMVSAGSSRVSLEDKNEGSNKISISATTVDFGQTVVKSSSKCHLEFTNVCPTNIRWLLTSFAPAYVKDPEPPGDLYRSTYAAFVFSHTSGLLEPGAKVKIPVTFNPMSEGCYSQFWDLEHHEAADSAAMSLDKVRVQLVGQGMKSSVQSRNAANACKSKTKENSGIYVSEDTVRFPDVPVLESAMLKIPVKNSSKESHNVRFMNVRAPFHITHQRHTIRPMSYACLPVTFKPTAKGEFEGTLVIQAGPTHSLTVTLLGRGT